MKATDLLELLEVYAGHVLLSRSRWTPLHISDESDGLGKVPT